MPLAELEFVRPNLYPMNSLPQRVRFYRNVGAAGLAVTFACGLVLAIFEFKARQAAAAVGLDTTLHTLSLVVDALMLFGFVSTFWVVRDAFRRHSLPSTDDRPA